MVDLSSFIPITALVYLETNTFRPRLHSNGTIWIRHNFVTFHSRLHSDGLDSYRYALAFTLYRNEGHFVAWACAMKLVVYLAVSEGKQDGGK